MIIDCKKTWQWIILLTVMLTSFPITFGVFITILPKEKSPLKVGEESAILTCIFAPEAKNVSWIDNNGLKVKDYSRLNREDNKLDLYFNKIQRRDEGIYTCQAILGNDTLNETKEVEVIVPISIVDTQKEQTFESHTDASVSCIIQGNPNLIYWMKESTKINTFDSAERIFLINNRTDNSANGRTESRLIIRNITRSDEALYVCNALQRMNGIRVQCRINVDVQFAPATVQIRPISDSYVKGARVELKCSANGDPPPNFAWYRSGSTLPLVKVDTYLLENINSSDAGIYVCVASNQRGDNNATVQITVHVPPQLEVNVTPSNPVRENSPVVMTCSGTGIPPVHVSLFRNEENLTSAGANEETTRLVDWNGTDTVTASFDRIQYRDAGLYECRGRNAVNKTEKSLILEVLYSPRWNSKYTQTVQGCLNTEVTLKCSFHGNPAPEITWVVRAPKRIGEESAVNSTEIPNVNATMDRGWKYISIDPDDDRYDIIESSGVTELLIKNVRATSYGSYYCRGKNDLDEKVVEIQLKNSTKPKRPSHVRIPKREITTKEATLHFSIWRKNVEAELIKFQINIKSELIEEPQRTMIENTDLSKRKQIIRIKNLKPSTNYSLQVLTFNCRGPSNQSDTKYFKTAAIQNPEPLKIVSSETSNSSATYVIKWEFKSNGGGTWKNISINYKKDLNESSKVKPEKKMIIIQLPDENNLRTSYRLRDLSSSTNYIVTVTAFNEAGSAKTVFRFRSGNETKSNTNGEKKEKVATAGIGVREIIIVAITIIILLIILDVLLCVLGKCGLTLCIYTSLCAGSSGTKSDQNPEEGSAEFKKEKAGVESKTSDKQPLAKDIEPIANGNEQDLSEVDEVTPLHNNQSEALVVEEKQQEPKSGSSIAKEENETLSS